MVNQLFTELAALPEVEAIALGGSRAGDVFDEKSDYDVYLYCTEPVSEEVRHRLLAKYCSHMEIGNSFWEYEDNCILNGGVDIDILYRNLDDFCRNVASVVESHHARNGYTTCMWHNLLTSKILYDPNSRLQAAKDRFSVPYPEELKANIIARNRKLLHTALPAYTAQIAKAVSRGDLVSINHRTTAFLESYFDIIFALNGLTHPGEKRLIQLARQRCAILPENFEENLLTLFSDLYTAPEAVPTHLHRITEALDAVLPKI